MAQQIDLYYLGGLKPNAVINVLGRDFRVPDEIGKKLTVTRVQAGILTKRYLRTMITPDGKETHQPCFTTNKYVVDMEAALREQRATESQQQKVVEVEKIVEVEVEKQYTADQLREMLAKLEQPQEEEKKSPGRPKKSTAEEEGDK